MKYIYILYILLLSISFNSFAFAHDSVKFEGDAKKIEDDKNAALYDYTKCLGVKYVIYVSKGIEVDENEISNYCNPLAERYVLKLSDYINHIENDYQKSIFLAEQVVESIRLDTFERLGKMKDMHNLE